MKVKVIPGLLRPTTINSYSDLEVGQLGKSIHNGHIVLRVRGHVIDLNKPENIWDASFTAPEVEKLNVGDRVELYMGLTAAQDENIREMRDGNGQGIFGNKINAIKKVREITRLGLKEAKEYVDNL